MGGDVPVGSLAHKEEGGLFPHLRRQQADGFAVDVLPLAHLHGAHRDKQGPPAGIAQVVAREALAGVVGQAVDQLLHLEFGPHRVHGGGGVGAHSGNVHVVGQLLGNLVGDEGIACKGVVQPPQHRYEAAVQGAHGRGFHHRVGQHKVCAGSQLPQGGRGHAVAAGDHSSSGLQKERQGTLVRGAQHHYFIAKTAQHRDGAHQHDGRTGHGEFMAQHHGAFAGGREYVLGAQLPAEVQQCLRDAAAVLRQLVCQPQQFQHIVFAAGRRAAAVQQGAGEQGTALAGQVLVGLVQGTAAVVAEHGIAHHKVSPLLQGGCKIGEGGGGALHILAHQQHTVHGGGQLTFQPVHQPELAVQLLGQRKGQGIAAARGVHQQIGALGVGIGLFPQLAALQGAVTAVHVRTPFNAGGTGPAACAAEP